MSLNNFLVCFVIISIFFGLSESTRKGKEKVGTTSESETTPTSENKAFVETFLKNARDNMEGKGEQKHEIVNTKKNQSNNAGKRTSPVWNYFEEKYEPIEESDKTVAYCKFKNCNYKHTMISPQHLSNLDAHLESYHPDEHKSVKAAKEKRKEKIALRKAQKLQSCNNI
ncbi:hypothetical protein ACQ4LE_000607 [Meloidogyne hapla]